jgi:hypothetical protein
MIRVVTKERDQPIDGGAVVGVHRSIVATNRLLRCPRQNRPGGATLRIA